jgi:DNA-binding NarL/FixJ family response regulator
MQQRVRVLIADENEQFRKDLKARLTPNIEVCAEAADGREAIDLGSAYMPDVAVLALSLAIMDGIEVTRQLRRSSPATEVLLLSEVDREDLISEALDAGAGAYLIKAEVDGLIMRAIETLALKRPRFSR